MAVGEIGYVLYMTIDKTLEMELQLQELVDEICVLTGWPVGHAYLAEEEPNPQLIPALVWHISHPEKFDMMRQVTKSLRFAKGVGLPGQVFASKHPEWVSNIAGDPGFIRGRLALDLGLHSAFAFPVMKGDDVIAVLEFFSETSEDPDPSRIDAVSRKAALLGESLEMVG